MLQKSFLFTKNPHNHLEVSNVVNKKLFFKSPRFWILGVHTKLILSLRLQRVDPLSMYAPWGHCGAPKTAIFDMFAVFICHYAWIALKILRISQILAKLRIPKLRSVEKSKMANWQPFWMAKIQVHNYNSMMTLADSFQTRIHLK